MQCIAMVTVSIESAAADDLEHTEELMSLLLVSAGREHVHRAAVSDPVFISGKLACDPDHFLGSLFVVSSSAQ